MESKVVRVSMDYFFMSVEDEKASNILIIVMIDESSCSVYASGTSKKEVMDMDWLIEDMSEELKNWEHSGGSASKSILWATTSTPLWRCGRSLASTTEAASYRRVHR